MDTPVDRTTNYFPINTTLRAAGFWIGFYVSIVAQDVAGLNYRKRYRLGIESQHNCCVTLVHSFL